MHFLLSQKFILRNDIWLLTARPHQTRGNSCKVASHLEKKRKTKKKNQTNKTNPSYVKKYKSSKVCDSIVSRLKWSWEFEEFEKAAFSASSVPNWIMKIKNPKFLWVTLHCNFSRFRAWGRASEGWPSGIFSRHLAWAAFLQCCGGYFRIQEWERV